MTHPDSSSLPTLEQARELVWAGLEQIEEAQRVLFRAGDCYVREVWGDGVRAIIDTAERLTAVCGDLTAASSEIDRLARRDRERDLS
jgi:hypothetical protein